MTKNKLENKIGYVNLASQWMDEREKLLPIIDSILQTGTYVGGKIVDDFENKISELCGKKFCIALNSGTDALVLGLMSLGVSKGDEVITPPNSFIASTAAIVHLNATPVFVDVLPDQNIDPEKIEEKIQAKQKQLCQFI